MRSVEDMRLSLSRASTAPRLIVGLRACGPYRALTLADRYQHTKLIYSSNGDLVAVLESMDVVDASCRNGPHDATIHYGEGVDCIETDLVYPPP